MINYMDKMGKRSPLLTGKQKFPSLRDWDVKTATQDPSKEEYLDHYRGCIRIYNGAVQTLERRIAEDDESDNDDSEDGGNENGESEDTESDDAAGNSDVKRVNNDDESDEDEDAKTISAEPRGWSFHNFLIQT
ncbi:hypothetical protein P8452_61130 [Trifolium repens]|nr:hypothetical protein P8452_61130 [Trifolium repens]